MYFYNAVLFSSTSFWVVLLFYTLKTPKNKKTQTKPTNQMNKQLNPKPQVMQRQWLTTSHPQTNASLLGKLHLEKPHFPPPSSDMASHSLGHPFGQLGSAFPAGPSPSFLCAPRLLSCRAAWEIEKILTPLQSCSLNMN